MMVSLGRTDFSLKPLPSNLVLVNPSGLPVFSIQPKHCIKLARCSRGKVRSYNFCGKYKRGSICLANSKKIYSVVSQRGRWEDPDDGTGSEYDDDSEDDEQEKMEDNDLEFESDWEPENHAAAHVNIVNELSGSNNEEDLVKEVEQLLSPEERATLQANETPYLEKISTAKWHPFHTFALAGQIKFMDRLLEDGLNIDLTDKDGLTALHHAIIGKKEAVISHLLRKGANPRVWDLDGATPLHFAVQVGAMQTVKLLLKYNVDVNAADNEGWTPLLVALQSRNRDIAKILLVNGADKTRRNKDGNSPLDLSLCYGKDFKSYDLTKLLKLVPANMSSEWLSYASLGSIIAIDHSDKFPFKLNHLPSQQNFTCPEVDQEIYASAC